MPWERHPDTVDVMGKAPTQRDRKYLLDLRHRDSRRIQMHTKPSADVMAWENDF